MWTSCCGMRPTATSPWGERDSAVNYDLEVARRTLEEERLTFAIVKEGRLLASSAEPGVRPFFDAVAAPGAALDGAAAADRVVGRAVALLCLYADIVAVYTPLASEPAMRALEAVEVHAEQVVPHILNSTATGLCPFESLTAAIETPDEAFAAIRRFFESASGGG